MSYPNPILNLDFVNSKQLGDKVAFSRSSPATFFDRNGVLRTAVDNMPRFDHDPLTGVCKGLLVEPQVSFLETYSEQFDNAAWVKTRCSVTANVGLAPDGTATMDKLVEDTTNNTHPVSRGFTGLTVGSVYTFKISAKAAERSFLAVSLVNNGAGFATYVNLTNGIKGTTTAGLNVVTSYGGIGSFDVFITFTANAATVSFYIMPSAADNVQSYQGDGTSGLYIWGAKLYAGTGPTSYLSTAASPVTRNPDLVSVDLTQLKGVAGEALWTGTEGTVVVDFTTGERVDGFHLLNICTRESWSNRIAVYTASGYFGLHVSAAGDSFRNTGVSIVKNTRYKAVISFTSTEYWISMNGVDRGGNTHTMPQGMPHIVFSEPFFAGQFGGCIGQLQIYNRAVSKADAPALSAL